MKRTLIIGASGQIGKMLTQEMLNSGFPVTALVRDKTKLSNISGEKFNIIEGDLLDDFEHAFAGCSNVIFVAGSGGDTGDDKTLMIDLWAACKTTNYAKNNGMEHFFMVSSIGADEPSNGPSEMQPYLVAKHMADEHLINSGLHYTILRPGTLTDDDAKGGFTQIRSKDQSAATITRADVAKAITHILNNRVASNRIIELFNGNKSLPDILS